MEPARLPAVAEAIRAEAFGSDLHPRTVGHAGSVGMPAWRMVYLERGEAQVLGGSAGLTLTAPSVTWQPWGPEHRLRIAAGAVGTHLLVGPGMLAGAIGHKPESPDLRFMAERRVHLPLAGRPELEGSIARALAGLVAEVQADQPAARTVVEAVLRIVLIRIWRAQGTPQAAEGAGAVARRFLVQFTNLVEVHFRERWTVERYAAAMGISADRLTDICRRARGRTPRQIVAARLAVEARQMLESSLQSIDQIAGQLGFHSAAQFSRFFRTVEGLPPGQFRRRQAEQRPEADPQAALALFEWP